MISGEEAIKMDNAAHSSYIPGPSQVSNNAELPTMYLDTAEDLDSSLSSIDPAQFDSDKEVTSMSLVSSLHFGVSDTSFQNR